MLIIDIVLVLFSWQFATMRIRFVYLLNYHHLNNIPICTNVNEQALAKRQSGILDLTLKNRLLGGCASTFRKTLCHFNF